MDDEIPRSFDIDIGVLFTSHAFAAFEITTKI